MPKKSPNRVGFHKGEDIIDLPNLIEIQKNSYKNFLQVDSDANARTQEGLEEVFS